VKKEELKKKISGGGSKKEEEKRESQNPLERKAGCGKRKNGPKKGRWQGKEA